MVFRRLKKSTKEQEEQFSQMMEEENVGCADKFAMLVAAFFTIMLPCIGILVAFAALMLWLIGAL